VISARIKFSGKSDVVFIFLTGGSYSLALISRGRFNVVVGGDNIGGVAGGLRTGVLYAYKAIFSSCYYNLS